MADLIKDLMDAIRERDGYEPGVWPPKAWEPILAEIGRIVFNWNTIERSATNLLNVLIGADHRAIIVTAHMGNRSKMDALTTIANEFLRDEEKEAVLHCVKVFNELLDRRNYYIHSFSGVSSGLLGGDYKAQLSGYHAKTRLKQRYHLVTHEDLDAEARLIHAANHYFARVHNHFRYPKKVEYASMPEKFPLPETLTKPTRYVLNDQRPPQS